jgi:hypothetical protein
LPKPDSDADCDGLANSYSSHADSNSTGYTDT